MSPPFLVILIACPHDGKVQSKGLINAEFSYGRWNGSDAKALEGTLGKLLGRLSGFSTFSKLISITVTSRPMSRTATKTSDGESSEVEASEILGDTELIRQLNTRRIAMESEHGLRLDDILPLLHDSTADLRMACAEALGAAQGLIIEINDTRWFRSAKDLPDKEAALNAALERLRANAESFKADRRLAIVKPFIPMLAVADEKGRFSGRTPLRSLVVCSSFSAQLLVLSDGILDLLELIQATSHKRQKARLWAPNGLRALAKVFTSRNRGTVAEKNLGEDIGVEIEQAEKDEEGKPYSEALILVAIGSCQILIFPCAAELDPDSRPPSNIAQRIMNGIHSTYKWLQTPEAMVSIPRNQYLARS